MRDISIPVPKFSRETGEVILAHLLVTGYLQEDFHFTPYSTISYLKRGPKAAAAMSDKHNIIMHISGKSVPLLSSEESHKTERKIPLTSNNKSLAPYQKIETLNETMTKSVSLKTTRVPKVEVLDQRIASDDDIQVCGAEKRRSSWKRKVIVLDTDSDD